MATNQAEKHAPKVLYHYCSISTFYNIIKNRSIWLSDVSKSNDSEEIRYALNVAADVLAGEWKKYTEHCVNSTDIEALERCRQLFSEYRDSLSDEKIKCWVFCLSEKGDDLGQWRGYACDGTGIAIGFHTEALQSVNKRHRSEVVANPSTIYSPRFQKVVYGEDAKQLFEMALPGLLEDYTMLQPDSVVKALMSTAADVAKASVFYKNAGFRKEEEWRIVFSMNMSELLSGSFPLLTTNSPAKSGFYPSDYGFAEKNGNLVSHIEFQHTHFDQAIAEIIIGPKCQLTEDDVYLLLIEKKLIPSKDSCPIRIFKSASSYR